MCDIDLRLCLMDDGTVHVQSYNISKLGQWYAYTIPVAGGKITIPQRLDSGDVQSKIKQLVRSIDHWAEIEPAVRLALNSLGKDDEAILGEATT